MRSLLFASFLVTMFACDESMNGPTVPIDKEFVLAPGESSVVDEISVRFVGVVSDSRCPSDVNCVWQGDAQVQILVTTSRRTQEYELHTSDMKPVAHDGFTIHLVQLQPYPISVQKIQSDEYRVTLKVTKT